MSLWTILSDLFTSLLSALFAWRYDANEEPPSITAKRRELVDTIPRGATVLEIGAGTGSTLLANAYEGSAGRFASLTLSEPDKGMRDRIAAKLEGRATGVADVSVIDGALPVLPFADAHFDAVVCFFVVSHVDGRSDAIAEMVRVLKPGGKLLLMDHGVHKHDHGHGAHGHEHQHRPAAFFWDMIKWSMRKDDDMDLNPLLKDFSENEGLEEQFHTIIPVEYFFKEITYGCYSKRGE